MRLTEDHHPFRARITLSIMVITLFLPGASPEPKAQQVVDVNSVAVEREKLALEQERLEIEKVRFAREKWQFLLTPASIVIPLIVLGISLRIQARTAYKLQAVEIIMASKSTDGALKKTKILKTLLPGSITKEFDAAFKADRMPGVAYQEKRLEFFKAMAAHTKDHAELFAIFRALYSNDPGLVNEFAKALKTFLPEAHWVKNLKEIPRTPNQLK